MIRPVGIIIVSAAAGLAAQAAAADNVMKTCGARYRAAKAAATLPAGQTWMQFLAQCRVSAAPATGDAPSAAPAPSTVGEGQRRAMAAMHDRQRACSRQWTAAKAAGTLPAGEHWPHYWSQCNARLKG